MDATYSAACTTTPTLSSDNVQEDGADADPDGRKALKAENTSEVLDESRPRAPPPRRRHTRGVNRAASMFGDPTMRGMLADYLLRCKGDNARRLVDWARATERSKTYKELMREVARETLSWQITEYVMTFMKSRQDPEWDFRGVPALVQRCKEIVDFKQAAICLRSEVDREVIIRVVHDEKEHRAIEARKHLDTSQERLKRLGGFWDRYHAREGCGVSERSSEGWRAELALDIKPSFYSPELQVFDLTPARSKNDLTCAPSSLGLEPPATGNRPRRPRRLWTTAELEGIGASPSSPSATPLASPSISDVPSALKLSEVLVSETPRASRKTTMFRRKPFTNTLEELPFQGPHDLSRKSGKSVLEVVAKEKKHRLPSLNEFSRPLTSRASNCLPVPNCLRPGTWSTRSTSSGIGLTSMTSTFPSSATCSSTMTSTMSWDLPPPALMPEASGAQSFAEDLPREKYMEACHLSGLAPLAVPFVTGHSLTLNVCDMGLEDRRFQPITAMLAEMETLEEVDLSGNVKLSDKALVPFFETLCKTGSASAVVRLSLSCCKLVGNATLKSVVKLMLLRQAYGGLSSLRELDLGGISIATSCFSMLASAVGQHPKLEELVLTDTGLGCGGEANCCKVISDMLNSRTLVSLDIGWSLFSSHVFTHLGSCLEDAPRLRALNVQNCSGSAMGSNDFPVEYFLERLGWMKRLTKLDISVNKIDFRGALIVEDALEQHGNLTELNISENNLGVGGIRSILRALARDTSALVRIRCEHCTAGNFTLSDEDARQVFSTTNPGGRYSLDLTRPYHRALLRVLQKSCERLRLSPGSAFADLTYLKEEHGNGFKATSFSPPRKDDHGLWVVPSQGKLSFTFNISFKEELKHAKHGLFDFCTVLSNHNSMVRVNPSFKKAVCLFAHWKSLGRQYVEQLAILDALSMDFVLTFPQLQELARNREITNEVLCRAMHCLVGGQCTRYLSMLLTPSPGGYIENIKQLHNWFNFRPDNPTYHYCLNLANPADHMVGDQLMILDRWEVEVDRHLQRADVSQWANRSHIRNMTHQGTSLLVKSVAEWSMPNTGEFAFDYTTGKRPPTNAQALDSDVFSNVMEELLKSELEQKTQIEVLQQVSFCFYLTSLQMRELLGLFQSDTSRADAFALFYFRVVDMHNEKVFRVRFDDRTELVKLQQRLGYATFFPFIQPERSYLELDLECNDQRLALNLMVILAGKEGVANIREPYFVDGRGFVDPLLLGVPRSWEIVERIPTSGTFKLTYICAPEDRHFATRKVLYEKYGHWKLSVVERDVMWWSGLGEAPQDVHRLTEWLFFKFETTANGFYKIDGPGGNGAITCRRLKDGIEEFKCRKFVGPDEEKRIETVFRFLDPSGEGTISMAEWAVLDQFWREMNLCMQEFTKFLWRIFDHSPVFLTQAWEVIDVDASNEITEAEWHEVVKLKFKYFGPSAIIFHYVDKDDQGTISLDEFQVLQVFVPTANPSRHH